MTGPQGAAGDNDKPTSIGMLDDSVDAPEPMLGIPDPAASLRFSGPDDVAFPMRTSICGRERPGDRSISRQAGQDFEAGQGVPNSLASRYEGSIGREHQRPPNAVDRSLDLSPAPFAATVETLSRWRSKKR